MSNLSRHWSFFLNLFTEFSDKNYMPLKGLNPPTSCVKRAVFCHSASDKHERNQILSHCRNLQVLENALIYCLQGCVFLHKYYDMSTTSDKTCYFITRSSWYIIMIYDCVRESPHMIHLCYEEGRLPRLTRLTLGGVGDRQ